MNALFVCADGSTFRREAEGDTYIIPEAPTHPNDRIRMRRFERAGYAIDQNTLCDGMLLRRRDDDSIPPGPPNSGQVVYVERGEK